MPVATLTTKGRITMPKVVRNALCLRSGDRVAFVMHGHSEALLKPITKSVDEVFGRLHDPAAPICPGQFLCGPVRASQHESGRHPQG